MGYLIGIDGGGTKTRSIAADINGRIVGATEVGPSNFLAVGEEGIKRIVSEIMSLFEIRGCFDPKQMDCCVLGLAGAGREKDQQRALQAVRALGLPGEIIVESDAYVALMGAFEGRPGIIIISGTGSICFGLDDAGKLHRCGGWGYLLGDEGSGYYIGHQGVLAALKDHDGRGEPTMLRQEIESHLGVSRIDEIISQVYAEQSLGKENIANLAPLVFECADSGDTVSERIVSEAAKELAEMIRSVGTKLAQPGGRIEVAHTGSVFQQKEKLIPRIKKHLQSSFREVEIHEPSLEPALGAIILGLRRLKVPLTPEILKNLRSPYEMV